MVLDGNSLAYRAFHALPLLATSKGVVTNAAFGFTNMLLKIIQEQEPTMVAVAFDKGRITFRNDQYSEYKANRKAMPEELRHQFPIIKDILKALRIPIYELEGYEGDDLIGTIVTQAQQAAIDSVIVTGDRDTLQLVNPHTKVLLTRRGITQLDVYDADQVFERFGVHPHQFAEFRGLMGDSSDNIPGVPGIGEKTAAKLLQKYQSLDEILNNIDKLPKRQRENFTAYRDQALLSKELSTIVLDVPITVDLKQTYPGPDGQQLLELFTELEFKQLAQSVIDGSLLGDQGADDSTPGVNSHQPEYHRLTAKNEATLLKEIQQADKIAVALQGTKNTGITAAVLATGSDNFYLTPASNPEQLALLETLCADENIVKYFHDGKAAHWLLHHHGIGLDNLGFDTMVASYLLNPASPNLKLQDMALAYLGLVMPSDQELLLVAEADLINKLVPLLEEKLAHQQQDQLYYQVELPLVSVLAALEIAGVAVDKEMLQAMSQDLGGKITSLEEQITSLAGEPFNINSPKQLGQILFEKLQLPVIKKTKTGYSTDASVLDALADKHEIISHILNYRQLTKLKSTYADGLKSLIDDKTGRIHTTLHQTVTATGRLSSAEPNLQNIPIRLELGRRIRKVFIPRHRENLILTADYSQIELRVLAHLSNDSNFLEAFNTGDDIHRRTASEIFAVSQKDVTPAMRERAKAVNFGIVYGISDFGLARDIKVSRADAKTYIDNFFARCPGVKEYIEHTVKGAKKLGYVTTLLNRRRYLPELTSPNRMTRNFGERAAMNTPIQGSAADIIKLAMVEVEQELKKHQLKSQMILQVHDELIFDVPQSELEQIIPLVKGCMEQAVKLNVPLVVDIKAGPNWHQVKTL